MRKVELDYLVNAGVPLEILFGTQYTLKDLETAGVSEESLTTAGIIGSAEDVRDGTLYAWVTIGEQKWMRKNLNYAREEGSSCYDDDQANCAAYGHLYDFYTAIDSVTDLSVSIKGICPDGWHLPSIDEWDILNNYIADNFAVKGVGYSLLEANENQFGFDAFLGGYQRDTGVWDNIDARGRWWAANEEVLEPAEPNKGHYKYIYLDNPGGNDDDILGSDTHIKEYKMSVRCLLDQVSGLE